MAAQDSSADDVWKSFLSGAANARSDPLFDVQERDRKLELAERVRGLMRQPASEALTPSLDDCLSFLSDRRRPHREITPAMAEWLKRWASSDEASLRLALASPIDGPGDPEARFARFIEATRQAQREEAVEWRAPMVLTLGSILNFALDPHSLPIIDPRTFRSLAQTLGHEIEPGDGIVDAYEQQVAFARWLQGEMRSIEVRDMLDVQAIIFLSAREDPFWRVEQLRKQVLPATDTESLAKRSLQPGQAYLAVSSCLGYEAPYLREWIEFHRLIGVERFFLYNNGDRNAQRRLLAPYVEAGIVVLHDWPQPSPQPSAMPHCLETHREDARWIAFIDVDEFIFSPTGQGLPEVLADYENWPAVAVSQVPFSMSGHRTKPPGLVIESYTTARPSPGKIKSVVDPVRVQRHAGPHRFICRGTAVDENRHPVYGEMTTYSSMARLRINHYVTKSEAEYLEKTKRFRGATGKPYPAPDFARLRRSEQSLGRDDRAILRYLEALRTRLSS